MLHIHTHNRILSDPKFVTLDISSSSTGTFGYHSNTMSSLTEILIGHWTGACMCETYNAT